jgi:serine protease Do
MTARSLAAAALLTALAGPAFAQPLENQQRGGRRSQESSPSRLLAPFQSVVAKVNESTVRVLKGNGKDAALGTVVFADGYILTKLSELEGDVSVQFVDGSRTKAEVVGAHTQTDLALLKVEKTGLVPLAFGDSKVAALGHWLAAAGVGSDPTAVGIVSVVTRTLGKMEQGEHLNANRGYLGIEMALGKEDAGVRVERVTPKGAADKAGLKSKDLIVRVNGKAITGTEAMREMLNDFRPGDKVALRVKRGDEELSLEATLTGQPAGFQNRSDIQNSMGGQLSGRRGGFATVLQTDMVVDPRNCGGAVVDLDGRVVGLCIARAGRVETLVLPGEVIRPVLDDLRAGRHPYRPASRPTSTTAPTDAGTSKPPAAPRSGGGDPAQGQRNQ